MNVAHEYGPSAVGHGEAQCKWCRGTNRENAILSPNHCEERAKAQATLPTENDLYYLQVKGHVGNSLLWWRKGRCGYTTEIRNAEVFSREAAFAQHRCRPTEDFPWRKDYVDAHLEYSVNSEKVSRDDVGAV